VCQRHGHFHFTSSTILEINRCGDMKGGSVQMKTSEKSDRELTSEVVVQQQVGDPRTVV